LQNAEDESPNQFAGRDLRIPCDSNDQPYPERLAGMGDYDSDTSSSSDSYTLRRWHRHDSPRKSQRFRVAERDDAEAQSTSVSGPCTQAIFSGEATVIEDDGDVNDSWMNLLNDVGSLLFPETSGNVYAEDLQMAGDYRRPPEATVTTAARTDDVALAMGQGTNVGNNVPSEYPALVVISTESRSTSPLPQVETESVAVGMEPMSAIELPSEVRLAAITATVIKHHGETINQLVVRILNDRPIELFPDRQRETLVTLAAVNFQAAGKQMRQKLSEARDEWDNLDEDTDEFQLLEFQDRVQEGTEAYLDNLVRWEIPTPGFHSR